MNIETTIMALLVLAAVVYLARRGASSIKSFRENTNCSDCGCTKSGKEEG